MMEKFKISVLLLRAIPPWLMPMSTVTVRSINRHQRGSSSHFDPRITVADDGGRDHDAFFGRWTDHLAHFVTRMKENAFYEVIGEREISHNRNALKDEMIELRGHKAIEKCPYPFRQIELYGPETKKVLVFLTPTLKSAATTIATNCKERRQIDIFFKARK